MEEFVPFAGMVFVLLMVLIIGGLILLAPLAKRLGMLIDMRLEERRSAGGGLVAGDELARLRDVVEGLQGEVAMLVERQEFTERLLDRGSAESGKEPAPGEGRARSAD